MEAKADPPQSRSRGRRRAWVAVGLALGAGAAPVVGFAVDRYATGDRVARHVELLGRDVSRLTPAELDEALQALEVELQGRAVEVRVGAARLTLSGEELAPSLDVAQTRARVLMAAREGRLYQQVGAWLRGFFRPHVVSAQVSLRGPSLRSKLREWQSQPLEGHVQDGAVVVQGGQLRAVWPADGWELDEDAALPQLARALGSELRPRVELPRVERRAALTRAEVERAVGVARTLLGGAVRLLGPEGTEPLELSAETLSHALDTRVEGSELKVGFSPERLEQAVEAARPRFEQPAQDASFTVEEERPRVVPGRAEQRLATRSVAEAAAAAALTPGRQAPLPLEQGAPPAFTTEAAEALGIVKLTGSFTTRHACCEPRVDNIHRAAALVHGKLLRPGETFSLNQAIGMRTAKNGFVPAPTIEEGEMVDSLGGGVSQFTTTLFNAVFRGGYDVIERQPHSYWFPRYPEGIEATLSWPKPDLVFRNDSDAGLLIWTKYSGTEITVQLYGDAGGRKVSWTRSDRKDIVMPKLEYIPNPDRDPEEEKVREGGGMGWSILVSRSVRFAGGAERSDQRWVIYKMRPRRVEVHPCKIPKGEPDYTGERCPKPPDAEER